MKKGKVFFNIIIFITVIAFISIVGYLAYYYINSYMLKKEAEKVAEEFENQVIVVAIDEAENIQENNMQNEETGQTTTQKNNTTKTISNKGYNVVGTIEIPKTKIKAPIVDKHTPNAIKSAVGILYGAGLNEIGNTVLVAHNYRNGTFFSNNKKLAVGDKIYITDGTGTKIEYSIYKTETIGENDFDYASRETNGKREISLSTCTTDATKRLVILAKET